MIREIVLYFQLKLRFENIFKEAFTADIDMLNYVRITALTLMVTLGHYNLYPSNLIFRNPASQKPVYCCRNHLNFLC